MTWLGVPCYSSCGIILGGCRRQVLRCCRSQRLLLLLLLGCLSLLPPVPAARSSRVKCKIRCGVVDEKRGSVTLNDFVSEVWKSLRFTKALNNVEIQFVPIKSRTYMTMDELVEAYMEIGTANASALIGLYEQPIAAATEKFGVPYFVMSDINGNQYRPYNLITVFPKPADLYRISVDIVRSYHLHNVSVFYETIEGLYLIEDLVRQPELHVRAWKVEKTVTNEILRNYLLEIRALRCVNIIVMCSRPITTSMLDQALHLSMLTTDYVWILPSLNQADSNLEQYADTQVNLTTVRLVQDQDIDMDQRPNVRQFTDFEFSTVYDSLLTLHQGLTLHRRNTGNCRWKGRELLLPTLANISVRGATGRLAFQADGTRRGHVVSVLSLDEYGLHKIGTWNSSVEAENKRLFINYTHLQEHEEVEEKHPMGREPIKIVTILEEPFVQLRKEPGLSGNDRFEGYCIDMLKEIAQRMRFRYRIHLVKDESYGDIGRDGKWNGIVAELINGNATMSVAPLTITSSREKVIDFTKPFKTLGISVIMKKPDVQSNLSLFIKPLNHVVWLLLLVVLVVVSLALFVLDKINPPGGVENEDAQCRFSIAESVWFTFASLVLTGADVHPRTASGRILAGALWFFSLIIIATYTANLAAFLTVTGITSDIQSVNDLLEQSKVEYGTVHHSHVSAFFTNTHLNRFQQMWEYMTEVRSQNMFNDSKQGFQAVRDSDSDYAFLWESPMIQYVVRKECDLMKIGQDFGATGYGIGMPHGASYRDNISIVILKMGEMGVLHKLEEKWWGDSRCPDPTKPLPVRSRSLNLDKVGGVFIVLASAIVLSILVAIIERLCKLRHKKGAKKRKANEKQMSNTSSYKDGVPASLQVEEPFLTTTPVPSCYQAASKSKHTNIF